jgi:hypothetical protein
MSSSFGPIRARWLRGSTASNLTTLALSVEYAASDRLHAEWLLRHDPGRLWIAHGRSHRLSRVLGLQQGGPAAFFAVTGLTLSKRGNDLTSILSPGCSWCLCASRWQEAFNAYSAGKFGAEIVPKVMLGSTNQEALKKVALEDLQKFDAGPVQQVNFASFLACQSSQCCRPCRALKATCRRFISRRDAPHVPPRDSCFFVALRASCGIGFPSLALEPHPARL